MLVFLISLFALDSYYQNIIYRTNGEKVECYILKEESANVYISVLLHGNAIATSLPKSEISEIVNNEVAKKKQFLY
jgi:hypothetical protein